MRVHNDRISAVVQETCVLGSDGESIEASPCTSDQTPTGVPPRYALISIVFFLVYYYFVDMKFLNYTHFYFERITYTLWYSMFSNFNFSYRLTRTQDRIVLLMFHIQVYSECENATEANSEVEWGEHFCWISELLEEEEGHCSCCLHFILCDTILILFKYPEFVHFWVISAFCVSICPTSFALPLPFLLS